MMTRIRLATAGVAVLAVSAAVLVAPPHAAAQACGPSFSASGPDAEGYGAYDGYPLGGVRRARTPRFMVASFSHFSELLHSETVATSATPAPLARDCSGLDLHYTLDG